MNLAVAIAGVTSQAELLALVRVAMRPRDVQ
jgi:hypothetical protein